VAIHKHTYIHTQFSLYAVRLGRNVCFLSHIPRESLGGDQRDVAVARGSLSPLEHRSPSVPSDQGGTHAPTNLTRYVCILPYIIAQAYSVATGQDRRGDDALPHRSIRPSLLSLLSSRACSRKGSCRIDGLGSFSYEAADRFRLGDGEEMELGYVRH
jgi:hypothetical protein